MKQISMKTVSRILQVIYWCVLLGTGAIVYLYEREMLIPGMLVPTDINDNTEFVVAVVLELVTLGTIPLSLYLMKIPYVFDMICVSNKAYFVWALVRLFMMTIPLVLDTLCYYWFMFSGFGYMAIVMLLAWPFIYPTFLRCEEETL